MMIKMYYVTHLRNGLIGQNYGCKINALVNSLRN